MTMIMELKNTKFGMVRSNISKGCFTRALIEAMMSGPLNTAFELLHSIISCVAITQLLRKGLSNLLRREIWKAFRKWPCNSNTSLW